jgi:hypothetical protein
MAPASQALTTLIFSSVGQASITPLIPLFDELVSFYLLRNRAWTGFAVFARLARVAVRSVCSDRRAARASDRSVNSPSA